MSRILEKLSIIKSQFLGNNNKIKSSKKADIDFASEYQVAIKLLEEINQKNLKELKAAEWANHKKIIAEAQTKIEEAIELLKAASKAPSNIVW